MNRFQRSAHQKTESREQAAQMRFRRDREHCFLTVVTARTKQLLPELYLLLTALGVQVVGVRAHGSGQSVVQELELASRDGLLLDDEQWRVVQAAAMGYLGDRLLSRPGLRSTEVSVPIATSA